MMHPGTSMNTTPKTANRKSSLPTTTKPKQHNVRSGSGALQSLEGQLYDDLERDELWLFELPPKEIVDVIFSNALALAAPEINSIALKAGDTAPDFILPDVQNKDIPVSSKVLRSKGPLVVIFLGNAMSGRGSSQHLSTTSRFPYQTKEAQAQILQWEACGATVVTISPNFPTSSELLSSSNSSLEFSIGSSSKSMLLRDSKDHRIAQMFRSAFSLKDTLQRFFQEHPYYDDPFVTGIDDNGKGMNNSLSSYVLGLPATYVIGPSGTLLFAQIDTSSSTYSNNSHKHSITSKDVLAVLPECKEPITNIKRLNDRMILKEQQLKEINPGYKDIRLLCQDAVNKIANSNISSMALQGGDTAPDFKLKNATTHSTKDYVSTKKLRTVYQQNIIVIFYRGLWCPYCQVTLQLMKEYIPKFTTRGATLLAISPQTIENSIKTCKELDITTFPVLSDPNNDIARQFNITYKLDESLVPYFGDEIEDANIKPTTNHNSRSSISSTRSSINNTRGSINSTRNSINTTRSSIISTRSSINNINNKARVSLGALATNDNTSDDDDDDAEHRISSASMPPITNTRTVPRRGSFGRKNSWLGALAGAIDLSGFDDDDDESEKYTLPFCATYIINSNGRIVYSIISCDETQRAEPEEILKMLPPPTFAGAHVAASRLVQKLQQGSNNQSLSSSSFHGKSSSNNANNDLRSRNGRSKSFQVGTNQIPITPKTKKNKTKSFQVGLGRRRKSPSPTRSSPSVSPTRSPVTNTVPINVPLKSPARGAKYRALHGIGKKANTTDTMNTNTTESSSNNNGNEASPIPTIPKSVPRGISFKHTKVSEGGDSDTKETSGATLTPSSPSKPKKYKRFSVKLGGKKKKKDKKKNKNKKNDEEAAPVTPTTPTTKDTVGFNTSTVAATTTLPITPGSIIDSNNDYTHDQLLPIDENTDDGIDDKFESPTPSMGEKKGKRGRIGKIARNVRRGSGKIFLSASSLKHLRSLDE